MKTVLIYLTIFNLLFFPTLSWADVNNLLIQKITREYVDERRSIEVGFRVARESKFAYEKLIVLKVVSEIGSDLSDLSSPTSQALGESYVSVVRELAEDMGDELDESSKNLFTKMLDVILPVVSGSPASDTANPAIVGLSSLVNSSPYAAIINGVGSMALQFLNVSGGGFRGVDNERVGTEKVERFFQETKPYVIFYETLSRGNQRFQSQLISAKVRDSQIGAKLEKLHKSIQISTGIDVLGTDYDQQLDKLFPDYEESLEKLLVQSESGIFRKSLNFADSARAIRSEIISAQNNVVAALIENIDTVIIGLEAAMVQAGACNKPTEAKCRFDQEKLQVVIKKFKNHKHELKSLSLVESNERKERSADIDPIKEGFRW